MMNSRPLTRDMLLNRGIGELYHDLSIDEYKGDPDAKALIKEYIQNIHTMRKAGVGLYLTGEPGTGKTLLSIEVLKAALRAEKPNRTYYDVRKTSLGELVHSFTNTWYDRSSIAKYEADMMNTDFLSIDDVEKTYISDGNKALIVAALDKVLRYRVERKRPIIITTNQPAKAMELLFGPPIASLLAGHCRIIKVEGVDYRKEDKAGIKWQRAISSQKSLLTGG